MLDGAPVLVEAKAHVREFFSPATQASRRSREKIERAFVEVAPSFGSVNPELWSRLYFQYANRLAHLWFFHRHGVKAHLLFVSYLNDHDVDGPSNSEVWSATFDAADYALGIKRNPLSSKFLHHTSPCVASTI
ncbi:MAG: hypothetical protein GKR98_03155 [Boseongicola sp.]|nr:MAG: hypothetical protein GKR98_03155 [Boseongicola sp.]